MEEQEMHKTVYAALWSEIHDNDRRIDVCETVWEKLFPQSLTEEEDQEAAKLFDKCYDELLPSLTLKEAIVKYFGPKGHYSNPNAMAFALSNKFEEAMLCPVASCCGSQILALVYQAASEEAFAEGDEKTIKTIWEGVHDSASVIYYG